MYNGYHKRFVRIFQIYKLHLYLRLAQWSNICNRTKLTDQGCDGAPDWIIKIVSPGNPENDYIKKLNLYKNAGVRKYWIVDPMCKRVIVYQLAESRFEMDTFSFKDKVKVNLYHDLYIDFSNLEL